MKSKGLVIVLFLVMAGVQWFVPYQMVQGRRSLLSTGEMYKFKMAPIDPEDPYRGNYLDLQFEENHLTVPPNTNWQVNDVAYVLVEPDDIGYARIVALTRDKPDSEEIDYIKSSVRTIYGKDSLKVFIDYPFDRYYINERMAGPLEKILLEHQMDSTKVNYALVRIRSGDAVLEEVYIDSIPVPEWYERIK